VKLVNQVIRKEYISRILYPSVSPIGDGHRPGRREVRGTKEEGSHRGPGVTYFSRGTGGSGGESMDVAEGKRTGRSPTIEKYTHPSTRGSRSDRHDS